MNIWYVGEFVGGGGEGRVGQTCPTPPAQHESIDALAPAEHIKQLLVHKYGLSLVVSSYWVVYLASDTVEFLYN